MTKTRRTFIKQALAASSTPLFLSSTALFGANAPSNRLTLGFIGIGRMGQGLLKNMIHHNTTVLAVCDVDTTRRTDALNFVNGFYKDNPSKGTPECKGYNDFRELIARKDIDAVVIATPDHWHAIPALAAIRAGKDVYCEKPLTHNIHEAIELMKAAKKHKRILQTGSMQRSSSEFRICCELVRNGVIGKIDHVDTSFGGPGIPCDLPEEPMEPGLDWEMWIGPARIRPYNSILSPRGMHKHFPDWRKYKEYGSGMVGDWGAHHLDITQWGLGMDDSGPVEVIPPEDKTAQRGAKLIYANGIIVNHENAYGIEFYGENGIVRVNRGKFELILDGRKFAGFEPGDKKISLGSQLQKVKKEFLEDAEVKLYVSQNHYSNFFECVESRRCPITDEITGGRSAICCHLVNQAYYNHTAIKWDPEKLEFADGTGDPKWLTRDYRKPWSV